MIMKCNGCKRKVENYFILVIIFATIGASDHAKIPDNSSSELSIVERLQRVRQLGHSLFYDWNLGGESEIEGRTFGRIRMMRQIMLPLTFLGGFLTAVIIGIKMIGIVNMILISKVLMLNLAFAFGKLMVGKALWFHQDKFHGHHHSSHWAPTSYLDRLDDQSALDQYQEKPTFPNKNVNYYLRKPQQYYPADYSSPQLIGMQPPSYFQPQINAPQHSLYKQLPSNYQDNSFSSYYTIPRSSMSPAELDKLLTDTLNKIPPKQ